MIIRAIERSGLLRSSSEHAGRVFSTSTRKAAATPQPKEEEPNSPVTPAGSVEFSKAKPFEQIPGHRILPIVGSVWAFLMPGSKLDITRAVEFQQHMYNKFGPIWRDSMPGLPPLVTTTSPEDAETLFRTEGKFPTRGGLETLKAYREKRVEHYQNNGILVSNGDPWWQIRAKAQQPFLKTKNVNHYVPTLGHVADEFVDRIRSIRMENNEMKPDFINDMYRWALESVALVGLNTRLGCLNPNLAPDSEAQRMIDAANVSFTTMNELEANLPYWRFFETPTLKKLFAAQDFFTDTALKYINQTMDAIRRRPADSDEDPSILEELLLRGLSPKDTMVMVIDMLMAGIDTTSHTTSFLLYFLAKNPDKQNKLREEILKHVGPKGSPVTSGALNELHYLKACVKESLRLRPATIGNARVTDKDLVISGYHVPKGAMVMTAHQFMGQLDKYFPKPNEFIPERWIKGSPEESHHHPYTLLPFGFGTRMCIGRRLAELEMWQLTAKVLQNFRIEYDHGEIGCIFRIVNAPDKPLRLKFIDLP